MAQTPLPPAPGVLEVKMSYLQGQQILQNTYHVHKSGAWSPEQIQVVLDVFSDWENSDAKAQRSSTTALAEIRATDLTSPTSNYASRDINPVVYGTHDGNALPENVTFAVQAGTGKRGRGRQGRVFWIGLTETMTNGSTMEAASALGILDALNALLANVNGGTGGEMVTLHRREGEVYINPATTEPIGIYGASDLTTDSQKNRLPNHRRHKRPTD